LPRAAAKGVVPFCNAYPTPSPSFLYVWHTKELRRHLSVSMANKGVSVRRYRSISAKTRTWLAAMRELMPMIVGLETRRRVGSNSYSSSTKSRQLGCHQRSRTRVWTSGCSVPRQSGTEASWTGEKRWLTLRSFFHEMDRGSAQR
jgi:hypothetical protein